MATLGPAAKMRRVLEFLIGLRDDRVLAALADYGFTADDRDKGWELLRGLGLTQAVPKSVPFTNATLVALDAWRQRWMRIVSVSLVQDFPRVYDQIFSGIDEPKKPSFAVVPVLADRIEKLERAKDATSRAALAKLRKRGLSSERMAEARRLVTDFVGTKPPEMPDMNARRTKIHAAETALWNYFVEWSHIARTVIKEPRLLELLGFRGGATDDEQPTAIAEQPSPASPATQTKRATRSKKKPRKT
jgi:hypothetical protein